MEGKEEEKAEEEEIIIASLQKEKDLELCARIGQGLLSQNRELQQRSEFLEAELLASQVRMFDVVMVSI